MRAHDARLDPYVAMRMPLILTVAGVVHVLFAALDLSHANRFSAGVNVVLAASFGALATAAWRGRLPLRASNGIYGAIGLVSLAAVALLVSPTSADMAIINTGVVVLGLGAIMLSWPWYSAVVAGGVGTGIAIGLADAPALGSGVVLASVGVILHARRLTEIRRALDEEARFRLIAENASDGIARIALQPRRHYGYVSPGLGLIFGRPTSDFHEDRDLIRHAAHPEDRALVVDVLRKAAPSGDVTFRIVRPDGEIRAVHARYARDEEGYVAVMRDVTELLAAHDSLRRAVRVARMGSWTTDLRTGQVRFTPEMFDLLRLDPATHVPTQESTLARMDGPTQARVAAWRATGRTRPFDDDLRIQRGDGTWAILHTNAEVERDADGAPARIVAAAVDVTAQREQAARLEEVRAASEERERLTALGTLVAGVAHEINNPLAYMQGNAELIEMALAEHARDATIDEVRGENATILRGIRQITEVTRSLRQVARGDRGRAEPASVREVVDDVLRVASPRLSPSTSVESILDEPTALFASRSHATQIILNLVLNAADALRDTPDGHIRVAVRANGPLACIEVQDDGPGLPPEVRARLFTPFFTTKHDGTGLGLSVSRRIAEEDGGSLVALATRGRGATFRLELPLATLDAGNVRPAGPPRSPSPAAAPGASPP